MRLRSLVSRYTGSLARRKKLRLFREQFGLFGAQLQTCGRALPMSWDDRFPCLDDSTRVTEFDRHYVYHTAWAARILAKTKPEFHIDIASSLYFASIVSAFVPVRFYDFRPADLRLNNITSTAADLTKLPFADKSILSLSCMHVVEHVGLGRYGDPLDCNGDIKAMQELARVLMPGGSLLFVVPVGKPRIQFNAHRIYSFEHVHECFSQLRLKEFSLIPDNAIEGGLILNASPEMANRQQYGCGCFEFTR